MSTTNTWYELQCPRCGLILENLFFTQEDGKPDMQGFYCCSGGCIEYLKKHTQIKAEDWEYFASKKDIMKWPEQSWLESRERTLRALYLIAEDLKHKRAARKKEKAKQQRSTKVKRKRGRVAHADDDHDHADLANDGMIWTEAAQRDFAHAVLEYAITHV